MSRVYNVVITPETLSVFEELQKSGLDGVRKQIARTPSPVSEFYKLCEQEHNLVELGNKLQSIREMGASIVI